MNKLLDKYIIKKFITNFLFIMISFTVIFSLQTMHVPSNFIAIFRQLIATIRSPFQLIPRMFLQIQVKLNHFLLVTK